MMIRYTTPTFTLTINGDVDLTLATKVIVSIRQDSGVGYDFTGDSIEITESNVIQLFLTQEQSATLAGKRAEIQVNWTYLDPDGQTVRRAATFVSGFQVSKNLLNEVI